MTHHAIRVLVIDQPFAELEKLRRLLLTTEEIVCATEFAASLAEGFAAVEQSRPDVIMLGLRLPDARGLDAVRTLLAKTPHIPVIVLTQDDDRSLGSRAMEAGAMDFLIKSKLNAYLLERCIAYTLKNFPAREKQLRLDAQMQLLNQLPTFLWTTNRQLEFVSSSGTAMMDLGVRPQDLIGMSLFDFFGEQDPDSETINAHVRALAGESSCFDAVFRGRTLQFHIEPLRTQAARIDGVIGVALDVTENAQMAEQLRAAGEYQRAVAMRRGLKTTRMDFGGGTFPCAAAGGDCFDFIQAANGDVDILLGDVAGHGVGAALFMASTRAYLRAYTDLRLGLCETVRQTNRLLMRDFDGERFVTLFLGRIDKANQRLTYVNAGHPTGFVLGANGDVKHQLTSTDLPLGVDPTRNFDEVRQAPLESGDLVVLTTDGVTEAFDPDDAFFGNKRMLDVVRHYADQPAQEIVRNLYHSVRAYSQYRPQYDDLSAVIIKVD